MNAPVRLQLQQTCHVRVRGRWGVWCVWLQHEPRRALAAARRGARRPRTLEETTSHAAPRPPPPPLSQGGSDRGSEYQSELATLRDSYVKVQMSAHAHLLKAEMLCFAVDECHVGGVGARRGGLVWGAGFGMRPRFPPQGSLIDWCPPLSLSLAILLGAGRHLPHNPEVDGVWREAGEV